MLAVLGFTVTGFLFLLFALSIPNKKHSENILYFKISYILLAVAFFGYAVASQINSSATLARSMIIGNVWIFIATLFMLSIYLFKNKYKKYYIYMAALLAILLLVIRVVYFYPEPYIQDSILVFNSERFVSFLLSAIFLIIWLPVNLNIAKNILKDTHFEVLERQFAFMYTAATFSAIIFLLAKKPLTLALSFIALSLAFAMLIISNVLIVRSKESHKHAR